MSNVPLPGHWRRDDGQGSAEVAYPTFDTLVDENFVDEQPLAATEPVAATEESEAVKLLNSTSVAVCPYCSQFVYEAVEGVVSDELSKHLEEEHPEQLEKLAGAADVFNQVSGEK